VLATIFPRAAPPGAPETVTPALRVTIVRRTPVPAPTPRPSRTPTPPPVTPAPRYTLAPQIVVRAPAPKAAATPHRRAGGAAARKRAAHRPAIRQAAPPESLAEGTHAGLQNGGTGTGAGPGNGDSGQGGTGTGTGTRGTGNGGDTNAAPCGDIYLIPGPLAYRKDGTVVQYVLAKVIERDGTVEVDKFPYPFLYPAERSNPFRHDDAVEADGGIPVQQPPPGTDISALPPAVAIVLKYTNPATGFTRLPACDPASPAPER
jgi:hypothetical protein